MKFKKVLLKVLSEAFWRVFPIPETIRDAAFMALGIALYFLIISMTEDYTNIAISLLFLAISSVYFQISLTKKRGKK